MRRIEEYKRLEDDRLQSKGKAPMINHPRQNSFPPRMRGNVRMQESEAPAGEINVAFKEPVHKILDKIKHQPYFRWPNRMGGDPTRRNQSLYCTYHKDKGHTTEQCRVLKDHFRQLAGAGYLKEFVTDAGDQGAGQGTPHRGNLLPPPLGIIEVIHAPTKKCSTARGKGVWALATAAESQDGPSYGKRMKPTKEPIAFDDSDLEGRGRAGSQCPYRRFPGKKGDDRSGKRSRRDVPRLVPRTWIEECGPLQIWYTFGRF
nr:uncharacterized protein LOC112030034 [Quercus suber]